MTIVRASCKRRADMENSSFISDAEWNALISEVYGELYQIIADAGSRYFESEATITATGATSYDEPDDLLYTIGVDYVNGTRRRPLDELMVQERHALTGRTGEAFYWDHPDDQIVLYPAPASGTYKLLYVPQPPDLTSYADGDYLDVGCTAGLRFLVWGSAVIAKDKGESNAVTAIRERERARQDLEMWAANLALTNPRHRTVRDLDTVPRDPSDWYYR